MWKIAVPVSIAAGFVIADAYQHNFFRLSRIYEEDFPARLYIYTQHPEGIATLDKTFKDIKEDFAPIRGKFESIQPATIYFDDPDRLVNRQDVRSVAGVFVPHSNKKLAEDFVKVHKQYEILDVPQLNTVKIVSPYRSMVSWYWLHRIVHSAIREYVQEHNLSKDPSELPLINISLHSKVETYIPYGKNVECLNISKIPKPMTRE